jgi:signal transduction histidine kinase/DNA-binding response OmpR family regulator
VVDTFEEADSGVSATPARRRSWTRHGAELCLIVLFVLTAVIIGFQHQLFDREIVVTDATAANYGYSGYADQVVGGSSTFKAAARPLTWSCDLKAGGSASLFCGYEVVLDGNGALPGVDLRTLDAIALTIDYDGPATALRFYLKNQDPRYSTIGDRSTAKINKVEFSVRKGRQTVVLGPRDFSVAEWWLSGKHFAPELARTQFDDVVAVEVSTATTAPPGRYAMRIESLVLRRSSIAPATLYLIILASWAVAIVFYMVVRVERARRDTQDKERAQAEARAALAAAKSAAERASEAKSDFLAHMSHELRTPLNAVLGYAQLLERRALAPADLGAVRTIHRSGEHLLSLITDLLDLSKIEAGRMELRAGPVRLRQAIAAVAEMVQVRAQEKGLAFQCVVDDDAPEAVLADDKRLRQILLNLLGNAVKFTGEGRVSLRVSVLEQDAEAATLRFEVQDSGPGIAEDELERIFQPFEQVGEIQRREAGTGLGLAISGQLAGLMGATIQVQSRLGQGACFWFEVRFPLADAPQAGSAPALADIRGYAGARRRLLVVDDNPDNRDLLRDLLLPLGFEIETAGDGREAVRLAQLVRPDLILMDLKMPVMDGHEATRLMRLIEPLKDAPIIAVSANNAEEARATSRLAGADDFVSKPIESDELLGAIGRALDLEWILADGARAAPQVEAEEEPAVAPSRRLRILAAEDNSANKALLRAMLQGLDVDLRMASNGAEAVEAWTADDFDLVLMDVRMPGMSGVEATRAIRSDEARTGRRRTPIVALSGDVLDHHQAEYRAAGMDACLAKPIELRQLYALIAAVADERLPELELAG